jgi:Na+/H+-dicarboxylate symporter
MRVSKIIANITYTEGAKALLKLTYYVLLLIIYIHFISCIWFRILIINKVWIPPLDYVDYLSSKFFPENEFMY